MEEASLFEIPKLENRLGVLSTIAHIAPLLGLLGTVIGMLSCFQTIQIQSAALRPVTPGDLSGGIAQALITTISGLLIAIPTFIAYNYFINRVHHFVFEIERTATELTNFIYHITEN
jgi:biopolymer transport protein ExbB